MASPDFFDDVPDYDSDDDDIDFDGGCAFQMNSDDDDEPVPPIFIKKIKKREKGKPFQIAFKDELGARWYYKQDKLHNSPQEVAFAFAKKLKHKFLVKRIIKSNGFDQHLYASFIDVENFNNQLLNTSKRCRNFYEISPNDRPTTLYLDIEWVDDKFDYDDDIILIKTIMNMINEELDPAMKNDWGWRLTNGSRKKGDLFKHSFHLLAPYTFINTITMNYVMSELFDKLDSVDKCVWTKNRSMRTVLSSKFDTHNPSFLVPCDFNINPIKLSKSKNLKYLISHTHPTHDIIDIDFTIPENKHYIKKKKFFPMFQPRPSIPKWANTCFIPSIRYYIDSIDNTDQHWEVYNRMLMTIYNVHDDKILARKRGIKWAMRSDKFNPADFDVMWNDIIKNKKLPRYNEGTLINHAKACNPFMYGGDESVDDAINTLLNIDCNHISYNERFVQPYGFPNVRHGGMNIIKLVKSALGTGKTHQMAITIVKALAEKKDCKILIIAPRRLFARSLTADLIAKGVPASCYLDIKRKKDLKYEQILVCQMESLHHLGKVKYDILIADEIESCLKQLSSSTMTRKVDDVCKSILPDTINIFNYVFKFAKITLFCDAFLSNKTISFTQSMTHDFQLIVNTFKPVQRVANFICGGIHCDIEAKLVAGKKCVFVTASKAMGDSCVGFLKRKYGHRFRIEYHNAESDPTLLDNVGALWLNCDLLVYTPVITVGINFDPVIPYFDNLYIYASAMSCCTRDVLQASKRVRKIKDPNVMIQIQPDFIGTKAHKFVTYGNQSTFYDNDNKYMASYSKLNNIKWKSVSNAIKNVHIYNTIEDNANINFPIEMMKAYLKEDNYIVDGEEKDVEVIIDDYEDDEPDTSPIKYEDIEDIDEAEFLELSKLEIKSEMIKARIMKHRFQMLMMTNNMSEENLKVIYNGIYSTNPKVLYNLFTERTKLVVDAAKDDQMKFGLMHMNTKKTSMKLNLVRDMLNCLGIRYSTQTSVKIKQKDIQKASIDILKMRKRASILFNIKWNLCHAKKVASLKKKLVEGLSDEKTKKINDELAPLLKQQQIEKERGFKTKPDVSDAVSLFNSVIRGWNGDNYYLKKGKLKLKQVKGKRVDISDYSLITVDHKKTPENNLNGFDIMNVMRLKNEDKVKLNENGVKTWAKEFDIPL